MKEAKKQNSSIDSKITSKGNKSQEFNDLISNWAESSKKILFMLNKEEEIVSKNVDAKSLMAYGAMGAHINMALQALKAAEFDQQ